MYCKHRGKGGNNNCFVLKPFIRSVYSKFSFYKIYPNDWVKLNTVYEKRKVILIRLIILTLQKAFLK